jgi:hypothetical protein
MKCPVCREDFDGPPQRRYCSQKCKRKAADQTKRRASKRAWAERNREQQLAAQRACTVKYRDRYSANQKARRAADPLHHWKRQQEYFRRRGQYTLHDAHVTAWRTAVRRPQWHTPRMKLKLSDAEQYRIRYRTNPAFQLMERIRRQFKKKLQTGAGSRKLETLLGYTGEQLRGHIERQFTRAMNWENFGRWHIDHILSKRYFDLTTIEGIRAYWALSNLRPLTAKANLEKGSKRLFLL